MKRAYRKRKKTLRINYKMLVLLLLALVAAIAIFVGGIMLIVRAFTGDGTTTDKQTETHTQQATQQPQTQTQAQTEPVTKTEEPTSVDIPSVSEQPGDYSCFNDAAFIGDSRVLGLFYSTQLTNAAFYCDVGMNVGTAMSKQLIKLDNGGKGNVVDAIRQHQFGKIFIQFGVNELGWGSHASFQSCYEELVNAIKAEQPGAKIYIQAVIPVTQEKSDKGDYVNNTNVEVFNEMVKQVAKNCGVQYVDIVPAICGGTRVLPAEASTDGIHLNRDYCYKWLNYLAQVVK